MSIQSLNIVFYNLYILLSSTNSHDWTCWCGYGDRAILCFFEDQTTDTSTSANLHVHIHLFPFVLFSGFEVYKSKTASSIRIFCQLKIYADFE